MAFADYFVDGGVSGGNGLSPASAFISVASIPWADGVRGWVRNTHREVMPRSIALAGAVGVTAYNQQKWLIGWPSDNSMAYYDERPAAGVSASWDADAPATKAYSLCGYKLPTLVGSDYLLLGGYCEFANFYFTNSAAAAGIGGTGAHVRNTQAEPMQSTCFNNIVPLFNEAHINIFTCVNYIKKLVLVGSCSDSIYDNLGADVLIVSSLSRAGALSGRSSLIGYRVKHLINYSNSITLFKITGGNVWESILPIQMISRVSGVKPFSTFMGTVDDCPPLQIDDYYGEGPRNMGQLYMGDVRMCSSAEARCNSADVMNLSVGSTTAANQKYRFNLGNWDIIQKYFQTVSGTPIEIRVPVYVDSTAVISLSAGGQIWGSLLVQGAQPLSAVRSNVLTGSPTSWVGSLCAGGSAYLLSFIYRPVESANVPFFLNVNGYRQVTSGQSLLGQTLFGEPYSV